MIYTANSIAKRVSKYGGDFYYIFLKREDGQSFKTCIDPKLRNFKQWAGIVDRLLKGEELQLSGLEEMDGNRINADSTPTISAKGDNDVTLF